MDKNLPAIDNSLRVTHQNDDGSIPMYVWHDKIEKNSLYIKNAYGKKILKLVLNDETFERNNQRFAQIKIIRYKTKKAKIYNDSSNDPNIVKLFDNVELTYHGGPKVNEAPKIHLKCQTSHNARYRTLLDCSLSLAKDVQILLPLFSLIPGHLCKNTANDRIRKKAHEFKLNSSNLVRIDLYLSGAEMNMERFINSMYSMNMFFSLDYLIAKDNCPFQNSPIIQPITGFKMKGYYLWVRCSSTPHAGNSFLQFYNNSNYYYKVMNRRVAYPNKDGTVTWKTMLEKEQEISQWYSEQKEKKANKTN